MDILLYRLPETVAHWDDIVIVKKSPNEQTERFLSVLQRVQDDGF